MRSRRSAKPSKTPVRLVELRVLVGPNIYFTKPAVKLTLAIPGWLEIAERRVTVFADRLGVRGPGGRPVRSGAARSEERRRFVARLAAQVTRSVARASGSRLAVRGRVGSEPDQIVVAYPWRRRGAAEALGRAIAPLLRDLLSARRPFRDLVAITTARLVGAEPGPAARVLEPTIPVVAVTGTNGKTTTVRLLAHLARSAGKKVAYSSTDGVFLNDRLVASGDYSGPGGAAKALALNPQVAILETARGGILLRGIGTAHNDVAVVTNVQADHLDLHGVRSLDQLAEVKAAIIRITKPDGWCVLNADDPRVLAMRRQIRGRPYLFSLDPDHPAIRTALAERGRAISVLDRKLTLFGPGTTTRSLVRLEDVPVTLAGVSSQHTQNAMAATAAALGIGLSQRRVVEGLRSFVPDPERNPGRANVFELKGRVVVIDYAHNEDGMRGLVEICRGLRAPGAEIWIAYSAAGDRTREIRRGMGQAAGRGADHLAIAQLGRYLRGADPKAVVGDLRRGAVEAGWNPKDIPAFADELRALEWILQRARPKDVVGIAALAERFEIFEVLKRRGARRVGPSRVKQLVRRARGS
ncbi:MAG: Mur ligase family protein [Actinomycetota bacterium]